MTIDSGSPRIHSLAAMTASAVFIQLLLGAAFRHKGFGIIPHVCWAVVVTAFIVMLARTLRKRFGAIPVLRNASLCFIRSLAYNCCWRGCLVVAHLFGISRSRFRLWSA